MHRVTVVCFTSKFTNASLAHGFASRPVLRLQPSFSGAPLVLNSPKSIKIKSAPISMTVASIASASANNATDDQWSAYRGMSDDHFPEVPPDGRHTAAADQP